MYHIELRQFPHNFCRFNLTERELREAILDGWARGEWIELGERKWNPHQANLTVIEGPQLPVQQLSLGRGWRNAVREGSDVTERLLAMARAAHSSGTGTEPSHPTPAVSQQPHTGQESRQPRTRQEAPAEGEGPAFDMRLAADSLGLEALATLGSNPVPLAIVWRLARERYPKLAASDCLKLAECAVHSLLQGGLGAVLIADETGRQEPCVSSEQVKRALLALDSWATVGSAAWLYRT
jgi:hypothetical protein